MQKRFSVPRFMNTWLFVVLALLCSLLPSCSSGGGGSNPEPAADVVSRLTEARVALDLTGESSTDIVSLLTLLDGLVLLNDAASSSVLLLDAFGALALYTTDAELMALSGRTSVALGPLDEVVSGTRLGDVFGADAVSGLLFRLDSDGIPSIHATKESVQAVTGQSDSRLSVPRFLTTNQIIAQDLVGNDLLRFGATQVPPQLLISAADLAVAAGVAPAAAVIAGWGRSAVLNSDLFARFLTTNNIVKLQVNGQVDVHMLGTDLEILFPNVAGLHIVDFVADTISDVLLLIVGEVVSGVERGIAVAIVADDGAVAVFSDAASVDEAAGFGYDLTDIGLLRDGVPFAIDAGLGQVLTFNSSGGPIVVADGESVVRESGTENPRLSIGTVIGTSTDDRGVVVPEGETDHILIVE